MADGDSDLEWQWAWFQIIPQWWQRKHSSGQPPWWAHAILSLQSLPFRVYSMCKSHRLCKNDDPSPSLAHLPLHLLTQMGSTKGLYKRIFIELHSAIYFSSRPVFQGFFFSFAPMAAESCDITLGNSSAEWKAEPHHHLHSRAAALSATCKHPLMCKTPPLDFPQSWRDETSVGGVERDGAASVDRLTFCLRSGGKSSDAGPREAPRTPKTFTLQSKDTGAHAAATLCSHAQFSRAATAVIVGLEHWIVSPLLSALKVHPRDQRAWDSATIGRNASFSELVRTGATVEKRRAANWGTSTTSVSALVVPLRSPVPVPSLHLF